MKEPTKYDGDDIPIFTGSDAFDDGRPFFIHLSTDYSEYEGKLHKHEFVEMAYVLSGEAEHEIGGVSYRVGQGDIVAIKRNTVHTFHPIDSGEPFITYDLMFSEEFINNSSFAGGELCDMCAELFYPLKPDRPDLHLDGSSYSAFGDIFHRIYSEYRTKRRGYADAIRAYTAELIIKLFRKLEDEGDGRLSEKQRAAARDTALYLEKNYRRRITLEELAGRMYFSKDYLNRIFREVMGMPVGAYLHKLRLDEACRLLRNTDKTVAEIAELAGFGDVKSFYTVFKRAMNITPGEYRNS